MPINILLKQQLYYLYLGILTNTRVQMKKKVHTM